MADYLSGVSFYLKADKGEGLELRIDSTNVINVISNALLR